MEAAGLVLGAVSFAGSISGNIVSIIQCLEYVQLGRNFGADFNRCQARLGALKLRLSRLGIMLGVIPDHQTGKPYEHGIVCTKDEIIRVNELLECISQDVQAMEQKSKRYQGSGLQHSTRRGGHEVCAVSELDSGGRALKQQLDGIVSQRLGGRTSWVKKTKWALYEKRHFDSLLVEIHSTLTMLEQLFPQAVDAHKALCAGEVEELTQHDLVQTSALEALCKASQEGQDVILADAVGKAIAARGLGHRYARTTVATSSQLCQGDYIAQGFSGQLPINRFGHDYGTTVITSHSRVRQGDSYGLSNIF